MKPRELGFIERHAARRARQGIPLGDFLAAFRTYHTILWDAVLDASRAGAATAEQALAAAGAVIDYVDLVTTHASAAYLEAQQLLQADADRVRRDLLEDLLGVGDPADRGRSRGRARPGSRARRPLRPRRRRAHERARGRGRTAAGGAHARRGAARARTSRSTVTRHGEILIVRAQPAGERPALRAPLTKACERTAKQGVVLAVGVSTMRDAPAALGAAYREATQALAAAWSRPAAASSHCRT